MIDKIVNEVESENVVIDSLSLLKLIRWARRYADLSSTYAPGNFNVIYDSIMSGNPHLKECDTVDNTLSENGRYFPYAQEGITNQCF